MIKATDFAYHLTNYLTRFLPGEKGASENTILSYRDTFSQLLKYCQQSMGLSPEKITMLNINRKTIEGYLTWIEDEKGNSIATRNQRLAAIHGFFKYVQLEAPEHLVLCGQILSISQKKSSSRNIEYLTPEGIKAVLSMPDTSNSKGRRDLMLLTLLYDTGARVSELINSNASDVRLSTPATIRITGKGNKTRIVPLMNRTAEMLQSYMAENNLLVSEKSSYALFFNRSNERFTRSGIRYLFDKYIKGARSKYPEIIPYKLSPHCFRHSKAVHLLQAGVNIIYIRDLLGHSDIKTTEHYAKIDSKSKREALEKASSPATVNQTVPSWSKDKSLMTWLNSLGKK